MEAGFLKGECFWDLSIVKFCTVTSMEKTTIINHKALLNVPNGFIMLACNKSIHYQFYSPESMRNGLAVSKEKLILNSWHQT